MVKSVRNSDSPNWGTLGFPTLPSDYLSWGPFDASGPLATEYKHNAFGGKSESTSAGSTTLFSRSELREEPISHPTISLK